MLFIEKALYRRNGTLGALHTLAELPAPQVTAIEPPGRKKQSRGIMRKVRNVALMVSFCMAIAGVAWAGGAIMQSEASQGVGVEVAEAPIYTRGNFDRERGR